MAEIKYMVFKLGEEKYGIKLARINGIEHVYATVPLPVEVPNVKGIMQLRGNVVPVLNLKGKFNITGDPAIVNRQLLVGETHGMRLAIEVDDVLGIVPVDEKEIRGIPMVVAVPETHYFENVVNVKLPEERNTCIVLSVCLDDIMSEEDFTALSNVLLDMKRAEEEAKAAEEARLKKEAEESEETDEEDTEEIDEADTEETDEEDTEENDEAETEEIGEIDTEKIDSEALGEESYQDDEEANE